MDRQLDGYIDTICLGDGRRYGIKAIVYESKPIICSRCGYTLTLDSHGEGICEACGTHYSTRLVLEEK